MLFKHLNSRIRDDPTVFLSNRSAGTLPFLPTMPNPHPKPATPSNLNSQ